MDPIRFSVGRPHTVAVGAILLVLFSYLAFTGIPVQLKPTVDVPRIAVSTSFRGASAVEVEEQITRELEDVLQSVDGLQEMVSESSEGSSSITLEFPVGTNVQLKLVDVVGKLNQLPPLPEEADEPVAVVGSATDFEMVMWLAAMSRYDENEVRRVVQEDVVARVERVAGVSSLLVVGGAEREVHVRLDPDLMVARGVTFDGLMSALSRGNLNVRGGTLETGARQFVVRTVGKVLQAEKLEALIVAESEAGSVLLGDVAYVVDAYREQAGFVNINGKPTVAIGVRRQVGANVVDIVAELDEVIGQLNKTFAERGIDVWLQPLYRETEYIEAAIGFVEDNLLLGAALAIGVLLVFLRSLRSILVVALTIPISLVSVFLVMQALDRSLNVISLAGIAFASGMVVDNAIVVLENIFRHLERGLSAKQAAIEGGREVWGGVLASTLTTIAVFVPILIQQDEASQLFRDLALAISAAVALSLAVALTVVPVLASLLYKRSGAAAAGGLGPFGWLYGRFCARLENPRPGSIGVKIGFVLIVVAAALASVRLAPPAEYLPTGNRNLIMFFASPIPGTRNEAIRTNFKPFEARILAQPEVERIFTISGGFNGGGVVLKPEYGNAEGLKAFFDKMQRELTQGTPGWLFFVPIRASLFQDPGKQFEVELSGPDFKALEQAAALVQGRVMEVPGVTFVRSSLVTGRPELHVAIDDVRAKDLGLDVAEVGRVVETLLAGRRLTTMIDKGREVDVNVLAPQDRYVSADELAATTFLTEAGEPVALGSVVTITSTSGPVSIRRLERERNVLLTVNIAPYAPLQGVIDQVEREVFPTAARELGSAYTLGLGGSADKLRTSLDALTNGLGLSVLIIYLLLVSLFRSWVAPVVILVSVPLALSGGLLGIRVASALTGGDVAFDVISMLGFVILAGLVVNNAILIVHQANNFRAEGLDPRRALSESARSRLRPILMSVITTVFGMLPLALGGGAGAELYQGLGAVIVGGLLVSTLFTLFVIPVLLSLGIDVTSRRSAPSPVNVEPAPV